MPQLITNYYLVYCIIVTIFSVMVTLLCIPSILHVARARHLYDDIGHFRKQHDHGIPRLGGVGIFASFMITLLLTSIIDKTIPASYILVSGVILFAVGLKDDLSGVNSSTNFLIQFIVAIILVFLGNIRISSMYGILDVTVLPYGESILISVLFIMLIVNAFNLIDGIDGLAGTTGVIVNGILAALFIYIKHYELATICLAITGSIIGFLKYNLTPAKIFMGDTGSLLIGLVSAIMAVKFMESNNDLNANPAAAVNAAPALILATLIGPIFDTLRVFTIRVSNGISPFTADRNHIHHRMLKLGFNHLQTTLFLAALNIMTIIMVLLLSYLGNLILIILIFSLSMLFNWTITFFLRSKERENLSLKNLFA